MIELILIALFCHHLSSSSSLMCVVCCLVLGYEGKISDEEQTIME